MSRTYRSVPHYGRTLAARAPGSFRKGRPDSTYQRYRAGLVPAPKPSEDPWSEVWTQGDKKFAKAQRSRNSRRRATQQDTHTVRVVNAALLGSK